MEKSIIRIYKNEEIKAMQEILGKQPNDYYLSMEELEFVSKMDLFDPYMIKIAKEIWKNRNNKQEINEILKFINVEVNG